VTGAAHALVIGDADLVRALGVAGIRSTLAAPADEPGRWSRHVDAWIDDDRSGLLERLERAGRGFAEPPVLHVERDWAVRFVARHRARLSEFCRFLVADDDLLHGLLNKDGFVRLAGELTLPVPRAVVADPAALAGPDALGIRPPLLVKPTSREARWFEFAGWQKALGVADQPAWSRLRLELAAAGLEVIVQELVPGAEDRIESYHVYVDTQGRTAGEFTGRKIRTRPAAFGVSTALVTTDSQDTLALGREVIAALGLRGAAKADFKRGPDGRLHLLEVNPRLSLWANVGAAAGVNLAALAHADLTGRGTPRAAARARPGVTWCDPRPDRLAARDAGVPLRRWLRWLAACDTRSGFALDDPMPVLRGKVWPRLSARRARS
jgi:D-aspartate ligase